MNRTEIINRVKTHLLAQGGKAVDDNGFCTYRGINNSMCAIGCLISDEVAQAWGSYTVKGVIDAQTNDNIDYKIPDWVYEHKELLVHLQCIHDQYNDAWPITHKPWSEYIKAKFEEAGYL